MHEARIELLENDLFYQYGSGFGIRTGVSPDRICQERCAWKAEWQKLDWRPIEDKDAPTKRTP